MDIWSQEFFHCQVGFCVWVIHTRDVLVDYYWPSVAPVVVDWDWWDTGRIKVYSSPYIKCSCASSVHTPVAGLDDGGGMDRRMWQDHLILCSKLIVEHAKYYTQGLKGKNGHLIRRDRVYMEGHCRPSSDGSLAAADHELNCDFLHSPKGSLPEARRCPPPLDDSNGFRPISPASITDSQICTESLGGYETDIGKLYITQHG